MQLGWEWGGECGLDPQDKSLRELYWAVMARRRSEWDRTCEVLRFIAAHGGNKNPKVPNPYRSDPGSGERKGKVAGFFGGVRAAIAAKRRRRGDGPKAIEG